MLREGKGAFLRAAGWLGANSAVRNSAWRRSRLLILCYHGISIDDEHEWNPELYMPQSQFRRRMETIRESRCQVLPLGEALERLRCGTLERPSVAITFDDGDYDFYARALPVIRDYAVPVTVYLTTYYCGKSVPVFDPICWYLLWKARGQTVNAEAITGRKQLYYLSTSDSIASTAVELRRFAAEQKFSAAQKHELVARLAKQTEIDFEAILEKRIIQIMTPGEVTSAARAGVDIQLHTHRHRAPRDRAAFAKEIEENRTFIEALTGAPARDFCYPSGVHHPEFLPWLQHMNVRSATTCEPALATRESNPLLLPRFIDTCAVTDAQFEGWLSGIADFLPRRTRYAAESR